MNINENSSPSFVNTKISKNLFLGLGIMLCGLFLGRSFERAVFLFKNSNTSVSVKGLVEKKIKSDTGNLYIRFFILGNNTEELFQQANACKEDVQKFMSKNRIQSTELFEAAWNLDDRHADFHATKYNKKPPEQRYRLSWSISICSHDVDKIKEFYGKMNEFSIDFMQKGIDIYVAKPNYEYTKLEDIRANMIAEATKSARKAADQFAQDSKCQVGNIKHANQGTIFVEPIGNDGLMKKVRLVSYIDFYLK